ncbi:MAG TPA: phosphotransferase family protein [Candidatus Dormibacteraeota bacterium]|nr:phosphotransferase family protein [Candidatus Dormibacteraeota bacterium]
MSDQIRQDIEGLIRQMLSRPELRVRSVEPIPEGHSGFTYFVMTEDDDRETRYVLRLPPPGARIAGPADVVRQGRIMSALHKVGLPTPAIPAMSSDPVVDGRPFILMEAVAGRRIESAAIDNKPLDIASSAVAVLKQLHALPLDKTGIGDEESVGLQAEMMRWAMLMQRAPEELTVRAGELGGLLAVQTPVERAPTLVHGDYHYGNMLFRGSEVVAVLDWEIAQIGQPLLDLGCLCIVAIRRQYQGAPNPGGAIDVSVADLYRLYGADPEEMRWYSAMSLYKYASIFGYNLMLHRRGKRPDPMYEGLTTTIEGMIAEGIQLLDRGV